MHELTRKFTKEVVIRCQYRDIERIVQEHFGFLDPFSIVAAEEARNDSCLEFDLDGKLVEYELEEIEKMLTTLEYGTFQSEIILNYLVSKSVLEPGSYIISISW